MSLESVQRFREAANENIKAAAKNWDESAQTIQSYIHDWVDKNKGGAYLLPIDFYREVYNKSLELLNDSKNK